MSIVLGINALHADAAAALVVDGRVIAAIAEERLSRVKHDARFPALAVRACLDIAGLEPRDVEQVAIGRTPRAHRARKLAYALGRPRGWANFARMWRKRSALDTPRRALAEHLDVDPATLRCRVHAVEHHLAHTASAYFASPWEEAAGFTLDEHGDFTSCLWTHCEGPRIRPVHRLFAPDSLGALYTAGCQFLGFPHPGDEGKVMALAAYGCDRYRAAFERAVRWRGDGLFIDPAFVTRLGAAAGIAIDADGQMRVSRHYGDAMVRAFGPPRSPGAPLTTRDHDFARGLQRTFESAMLHFLNRLARRVRIPQLVMAGGCALNSVANGRIADATPFRAQFIQPAAGDDGLALGAALYVQHVMLADEGFERQPLGDAGLGPGYDAAQIEAALRRVGVEYTRVDPDTRIAETADALAAGEIVGWFDGRMEWGPRALGHRSILAHPGRPDVRDRLNTRIKRRESFRPFAPAVLAERQHELFVRAPITPFMLHVARVRSEWRERLAAVCHVDGTARLQTVERARRPVFHRLIAAFAARTGLPALLNTSFNENEPIVCTPDDAIACYRRAPMDRLVIGDFVCRRPGDTDDRND